MCVVSRDRSHTLNMENKNKQTEPIDSSSTLSIKSSASESSSSETMSPSFLGKCRICKELGHKAKQCPKKSSTGRGGKRSADAALVTALTDSLHKVAGAEIAAKEIVREKKDLEKQFEELSKQCAKNKIHNEEYAEYIKAKLEKLCIDWTGSNPWSCASTYIPGLVLLQVFALTILFYYTVNYFSTIERCSYHTHPVPNAFFPATHEWRCETIQTGIKFPYWLIAIELVAFLCYVVFHKPDSHHIRFLRWVDRSSADMRHDALAIKDVEHPASYARVSYTRDLTLTEWNLEAAKGNFRPKRTWELLVSMEVISQLTSPDILKLDRSPLVVWVSMNAAAARLSTVNVDRFMFLENKYVYQESLLVAYALYLQMKKKIREMDFRLHPSIVIEY